MKGDRVNAARRRIEERADQAWALAWHRIGPRRRVPDYDGDPRLALVTVNRSTTRYLKLMLLTLADQDHLDLLRQIVIVDNGSRDGAPAFLTRLARAVPRVTVVEHRRFLNHARGMRAGLRALDPVVNVVLACDPDVVFRNPQTLTMLAALVTVHDAALVGELRDVGRTYPDIQASFLTMRRDWLARRDVRPWVNHGSPARWLEESVWKAGGVVVDFPSNVGGNVLHRGRSAVAAAREHSPRSSYATVHSITPTFMGVVGGAAIWAEIEAAWDGLLDPDREPALVEHLAARLSRR
jgi:hypothetical protein